MPGPRRKKPPPHHFEPLTLPEYCSEEYVQSWVRVALKRLGAYLETHARFAEWLDKHHRNEVA